MNIELSGRQGFRSR